jgi:hypothetical protein
MVPQWIPLGGNAWTGLTGIAFVLAGLAIVSGILDVLAARLPAVMWLVFSAPVLRPRWVAGGSESATRKAVAGIELEFCCFPQNLRHLGESGETPPAHLTPLISRRAVSGR